jgi:hypothetical protein
VKAGFVKHPNAELFERVSVLHALTAEDLPGKPGKPTLTFRPGELEQMRQNPPVAEEFRIDSEVPKYRVLGWTSEGFLIITGDPSKHAADCRDECAPLHGRPPKGRLS